MLGERKQQVAVAYFDGRLRATRFRIENRLVEEQFPATFAEELSFMHDPLQLPGVLFLVSAAASSALLLRSLSPPASTFAKKAAGRLAVST